MNTNNNIELKNEINISGKIIKIETDYIVLKNKEGYFELYKTQDYDTINFNKLKVGDSILVKGRLNYINNELGIEIVNMLDLPGVNNE